MDELGEFLWGLVSNGGSLGAATWAISAGFFWLWKHKLHKPDMANEDKVLISAGIPVVIVLVAFFGGALAGYWPVTLVGVFKALQVAFAEVFGSKVLFGVTRKVEKATEG